MALVGRSVWRLRGQCGLCAPRQGRSHCVTPGWKWPWVTARCKHDMREWVSEWMGEWVSGWVSKNSDDQTRTLYLDFLSFRCSVRHFFHFFLCIPVVLRTRSIHPRTPALSHSYGSTSPWQHQQSATITSCDVGILTVHQQIRYINTSLGQCWISVVDGGPTLNRQWMHSVCQDSVSSNIPCIPNGKKSNCGKCKIDARMSKSAFFFLCTKLAE